MSKTRAHVTRSLLVLAWLVGAATACVNSHEGPQVGTNTNWLKACDKEADCGGGRSCLCGMCSRTCESNGQCGEVHAATECRRLSTYACGESLAASSACVQGCTSNADCSATLEHGQCVDGLCIPAPPQPGGDASATGFELSRRGMEIIVTTAYTGCSSDEECQLVSTTCSCCGLGAIQSGLESTYAEHQQLACSDYRGPICDCDYADVIARCDQGRCRTEPRPTETCFSPWQQPERSTEPEALGCRCSARREAVACVGATGFSCAQENGPLYAWARSETGDCQAALDDPDCTSGERLSSGQECVVRFALCHALPSGEFCGR